MGKISINYTLLANAASNLKSGAAACRRYSETLDTKSQNKLRGITGGLSGYPMDAYTSVSQKKTDLYDKADRMDALSRAITELKDYAKSTDLAVSNDITGRANMFQSANGISCGLFETAWNWLCDGARLVLNATELGQSIVDAFRRARDWLADKWRRFKLWRDYDGGKFWLKIGIAVASIVIAIITLSGVGAGILAIITTIGALIGIMNGVVTLVTNATALYCYEENPYLADYMSDIDAVADLLDEYSNYVDNENVADALRCFAFTINVVDEFCAYIGLIDSFTKIYQKFTGKQTLFQKYLGQGGIVDSIFAKDISGHNSALRHTRQFDELSNKWYQLNPDGTYAIDLDGNRIPVDFSKVKKMELNFKTGIQRLTSTVFPGFKDVDGSYVPRFTGFNLLCEQLKTDLVDFPSQTKKAYANAVNNLKNMISDLKGAFQYNNNLLDDWLNGKTPTFTDRLGNIQTKNFQSVVAMDVANNFTDWTGIDSVSDYVKKLFSGKANLADTAKTIQNIAKIPEKIYKFGTLDWFDFGDMGTVNRLVDKISGGRWSEFYDKTLEQIKQCLQQLVSSPAVSVP